MHTSYRQLPAGGYGRNRRDFPAWPAEPAPAFQDNFTVEIWQGNDFLAAILRILGRRLASKNGAKAAGANDVPVPLAPSHRGVGRHPVAPAISPANAEDES